MKYLLLLTFLLVGCNNSQLEFQLAPIDEDVEIVYVEVWRVVQDGAYADFNKATHVCNTVDFQLYDLAGGAITNTDTTQVACDPDQAITFHAYARDTDIPLVM